MKMKGPHWVLVGVVVLYLFAPAQFEQGKGAVLGITSRIPGLSGNSTLATPAPADPAILAVRPILTGLKIGYFNRDDNSQAYYTITGTDITKATMAPDKSYWVVIRSIWRVRIAQDATPDTTWDASGMKILKVYSLLDPSCCSAKALAGGT